MKLRTSLCNPTVLKKDFTRFAPVWVLYTVGLFMVLTVCVADNSEYYQASNLADSLSFMGTINLCYGLLNAQLLFGDLFSARHCNALHAMPLRRECWFMTHILSGLLFSLVPNLGMTLVALPILGNGWPVALWWLLASTLQYLFFFGLAVFSALCVGNRFAMVLIYGIINFFALIVYWFYYAIYEPLLYGIFIETDPFTLFCPVWTMVESSELIKVSGDYAIEYYLRTITAITTGEGWGYLAICAGLGVALMAAALLLYRRRKLESAGDFMAVRAMEPVFLVLYSLCMAAFFQMFTELFTGDAYIFLALGLVVGFFTGRMLLMRTTRVFQPKSFLYFAILAAVFVASMVLTAVDPIGFTRYVPEASQIQSVKLSNYYTPSNDAAQTLTAEEDIEAVTQIHQMVLDGKIHSQLENDADYYEYLSLYYVLDSGVTVSRKYDVAASSPAGQMAREFYTRPEFVLGTTDVDAFVDNLTYVYYSNNATEIDGQVNHMDPEMNALLRGLVEAIIADCEEGTMAQNHGYHPYESQVAWIEFSVLDDPARDWGRGVQVMVFENSRHTVAYLEEHDIVVGQYG